MTFWIASLVFVFDRLSKLYLLKTLAEGQSVRAIPGFFHITLVFNNGTAFGLFKNSNSFLAALSIIVTILIVLYAVKRKTVGRALAWPLGLILGGALGNLVDRIKFGYVVDFLDFRIWPVFNVADSAITIGALILIWLMLTKNEKRRTKN